MHCWFGGRLPMPIAWGTECPFSGAERPLRIVILTTRKEVRFRPSPDTAPCVLCAHRPEGDHVVTASSNE